MFQSVFNAFFGCNHQRTTFPMTPGRRNTGNSAVATTYVACLDCGKEFAYDWKSMQIGEPMSPRAAVSAEVQPSFR
jgi:hypothetical protein